MVQFIIIGKRTCHNGFTESAKQTVSLALKFWLADVIFCYIICTYYIFKYTVNQILKYYQNLNSHDIHVSYNNAGQLNNT
jgi:hypothetical protein